MMKNDELKEKIIETLRTVEDPELGVNIFDLGLVYDVRIAESGEVAIDMTLTSPGCPVGTLLIKQTKLTLSKLEGVNRVEVNLVFDPPWDQYRMSEEVRFELGVL